MRNKKRISSGNKMYLLIDKKNKEKIELEMEDKDQMIDEGEEIELEQHKEKNFRVD